MAQYAGVIVIEWPPGAGTGPYHVMSGTGVNIKDAVTGKAVNTCMSADITVRVAGWGMVTAELTLFADADGDPILDGEPVEADGEILTGVFPFLVSEMRVRQ